MILLEAFTERPAALLIVLHFGYSRRCQVIVLQVMAKDAVENLGVETFDNQCLDGCLAQSRMPEISSWDDRFQ
jgi:hypothetical protein